MRKISSYLLALLAFASMTFLTTGCGDDPEDPITPLPEATGTVGITFRNYSSSTVSASPGDVLIVSVLMEKSASGGRPQKLRVWETTTVNTRGTQVKLPGGNSDGTIDLRNVDSQTKTVEYTVPTGATGSIYLYFEVDESASKFARKLLTINVGGAGSIDSYTSIALGAQLNLAPSRMSSSTGYVYLSCETAANIQYIDITYLYANQGHTLASNPARFQAPLSLTTTETTCGDEGTVKTNGGTATYFASATATEFNNASDTSLEALTVSTASPQYITVVSGGYYSFRNAKGKKGVIKVNSITGAEANAAINLDVKVQR